MNRLFSSLFAAAIFLLSAGCDSGSGLMVRELKCDNLRNPLGIDNTAPRLSWKVYSERNGTTQSAYRILVADSPSGLKEGKAGCWDSGKVSSPESVLVPYGGKALRPGMPYYWKVRIWDEAGHAAEWSPVAEFSIGILTEYDWQAKYIGFPTENGYRECPQLIKSFHAEPGTGQRFLLHVNSLGYHEAYLNGHKIGDGVLAPAVSQYTKRSLAVTYDVTTLLQKGSNQLMLWLGSGWYTTGLPGVVHDGPVVKAQLEKIAGDSREILLVTDGTWLGRTSGYTRQGTWQPLQFGGEVLDGSKALTDLITDGSDGRSWSPVTLVTIPEHQATPQMVEPNRITETLKPASITQLAGDTLLIDMGRNLTGWFEIRFPKLNPSREIILQYSDHLDGKGQFVDQGQTDRYLAAGSGTEVFRTKFNYHGFRYVRIIHLSEVPEAESVAAHFIRTGYESAASFSCSDADLNSIHDMISYTLKCLSLGGYLVDCPQFERLGYGGDGNASTETAQTISGLNPLYDNWLQAWADCIRDDGGMPHTAPNPYRAGGGPYWCGFIITASWKTYTHYGDLKVLREYYPVMQKWLGFTDAHSVDGLLKRWPESDYRWWYLGDWASPDGIDQTHESSIDLVNNCYLAICYEKMEKIARTLEKSSDADLYRDKGTRLREKILQTFFHPESSTFGTGTQVDQTFPLLAGIVPPDLIGPVTKTLLDITMEKYSGHIACGLVGIPVLTEWAVNNGQSDLMYTLLKQRDYPGYLYMIDNGATTTWEHWNGHRSQIHNCYNGVGQWFYQGLGGIRPEEDNVAWRSFIIQPQIPDGVSWAKTSIESPYGTIRSDWSLREDELSLEIQVPVGSTAHLMLPGKPSEITIDQQSVLPSKEGILLGSGLHLVVSKTR